MFYEIRLAVESLANNPKAPPVISKLLHSAVGLVCRMAPPTPVAPQQN